MVSQDDHDQVTEVVMLTPQQADAVVRVVEAAPAVRRRYQYFLWAQSQMQALLPHQILVCGAYLRQRRDLVFEVFHSIVVPPELLAMFTDTEGPLMRALVAAWVDGRGQPLFLNPARMSAASLAEAAAALQGFGIESLLVHGVARPQRPAEIESFFVFASPGPVTSGPTLLHIELLVPYLHWSWLRVVAAERKMALPASAQRALPNAAGGAATKRITEREREVLVHVSQGKRNEQIGEALGISQLTVKNHVQKILRKLGCSNRAQAVAEAISMGVLRGTVPH